MRKFLKVVAALAILPFGSALAQDAATPAMPGEKIALPAACEAAAGSMDMSKMMGGMDGMSGMMSGGGMMEGAPKANMQAMMGMHAPMMKAMMIKDPDLAFNCGMIVHHMGAIAMSKVEIEMGKDEESKKLAETIIAAQEKEIADMTAWVEKNAK
jgi:uncharacterized protein (DUF305 family)